MNSATIAMWFLSFREKPWDCRVKRRIVRIVQL